MTKEEVKKQLARVVRHKNCCGCGACVLYSNGSSKMKRTSLGPVPQLENARFSPEALEVCPGVGINYPELYDQHFGSQPASYLHGKIRKVRIGFSGSHELRNKGASGGIISTVLIYLLKAKLIDGVVCVRQGTPEPREAAAFIARSEKEILSAMQSVYIPVSVLDVLDEFTEGEKYALVGLPEQTSALRKMQALDHPLALQVKYVLGPYTGTALYPAAIDAFLRSRRVKRSDDITSLKWRTGEWPGHLEITLKSGKVLQSKKIYYNFLIPFFVTHTSLRSMDFVNEFTDLSVGDAWSPEYEKEGKGFGVFVTRNKEMEAIVEGMLKDGMLEANNFAEDEAISMHGHMLDFKKRGGYIRNKWRRFFGHPVPEYGYRPLNIAFTRKITELVISGIFLLAGNRVTRWLMTLVPEKIMGPLFDFLRLRWKKMSKPTKRKGLSQYDIDRT